MKFAKLTPEQIEAVDKFFARRDVQLFDCPLYTDMIGEEISWESLADLLENGQDVEIEQQEEEVNSEELSRYGIVRAVWPPETEDGGAPDPEDCYLREAQGVYGEIENGQVNWKLTINDGEDVKTESVLSFEDGFFKIFGQPLYEG